MKLLKIFALSLIAAAGLTACSDDEGSELVDNGVKVVASQTSIATLGGNGSVTVNKPVASAYANESWLNVSASGNTVSLTAAANDDRESRNAKLVIKASATDSVIVAVSQNGIIYNAEGCTNVTLGPNGRTVSMPVSYNVDTKVLACPAWAKAELADEVLTITVANNTSVEPREGEIKVGTASGKYFNTLKVSQGANADGCTSIASDGNGKTVTLNVVTGTTVKEAPEWVEAAVKNGVLTITIQKNPAETPRDGVVKYGDNSYTNSIAVAQEAASLWAPLGKALYSEDCLTGLFSLDVMTYSVDIQEKIDQPGLYRLVNAYGAAFPANEPGDWDTSKDYYMYLDCTNPNACYIPEFDTGCDWGYGPMSILSYVDYYIQNGYALEQVPEQYFGTLKDGVLTFPAKALLIALGDKLYYGNNNGGFAVVLPSASAKAAKKVSTKASKTAPRQLSATAVPFK